MYECVCVCVCARARVCVCLCVCVWLVLYVPLVIIVEQSITTVTSCCMRHDDARRLGAANTDARHRRHTTQSHHYTDTGLNSPCFILWMLSAEQWNNQYYLKDFDMAQLRLCPLGHPGRKNFVIAPILICNTVERITLLCVMKMYSSLTVYTRAVRKVLRQLLFWTN